MRKRNHDRQVIAAPMEIMRNNKKSICIARNDETNMTRKDSEIHNKLVASYRRCVRLINNQSTNIFFSLVERSTRAFFRPIDGIYTVVYLSPCLHARLVLYDLQQEKTYARKRDLSISIPLCYTQKVPLRYSNPETNKAQENEITKRWFVVFYEVKNLSSTELRLLYVL